jgi:GTP-binding protein
VSIKIAEFLTSSSKTEQCPEANKPEFAFIGRSNVGKSSLINRLAGRKALAKISSTPGKTQLINHFVMDNTWYLVDLPGYGYAKVSKKNREKFNHLIRNYFKHRANLVCAFVLVDCRHEPQKIDLEFMEWLGVNQIPMVIIFTKMDKVSSSQLQKNINAMRKEMLKVWESMPQYFITSAEKGNGTDELLNYIQSLASQISFEKT